MQLLLVASTMFVTEHCLRCAALGAVANRRGRVAPSDYVRGENQHLDSKPRPRIDPAMA